MRSSFLTLGLSFCLAIAACSSAELQTTGSSTARDGGSDAGDDGTGTNGDDGGGDMTMIDPDGGGIIPVPDGGVSIPATTSIHVVTEPSDNGAALLAAIKGAKKSVHITMYLLTDTDIQSALVTLKKAGKDVSVLLNPNFPSGQGNSNQAAYDYFTKNGVTVGWAPAGFTYTHAKIVIIDAAQAWIMTMNATYSSPSTNREFLAIDTDAQDVADAEKYFQSDIIDKQLTLTTKLVVSPAVGSQLDARTRMLGVIAGATKSLDVAAEELSDTAIVNALIASHKAGVAVSIVLSGSATASSAQMTAVSNLKAAGVVVKALSNPDMHAKAIIADGARGYIGSQNFTVTSLVQNREFGVITDNATECAGLSATIEKDYAAATAQ